MSDKIQSIIPRVFQADSIHRDNYDSNIINALYI